MLVIRTVNWEQAWEAAEVAARAIVMKGEAEPDSEFVYETHRGLELENPTTGHITLFTWENDIDY